MHSLEGKKKKQEERTKTDIRFSAPKYSAKRMFLITNNDNPHQNNDAIRQSSVQRAKVIIMIHQSNHLQNNKGFDHHWS